jgi:hypothetical protein
MIGGWMEDVIGREKWRCRSSGSTAFGAKRLAWCAGSGSIGGHGIWILMRHSWTLARGDYPRTTVPSVAYIVKSRSTGKEKIVDTPSKMPDLGHDNALLKPFVKIQWSRYWIGAGKLRHFESHQVFDANAVDHCLWTASRRSHNHFFDQLKKFWSYGYASTKYSILDYRESNLEQVGMKVDYKWLHLSLALSSITTLPSRWDANWKPLLKSWFQDKCFSKCPFRPALALRWLHLDPFHLCARMFLPTVKNGGDISRRKSLRTNR